MSECVYKREREREREKERERDTHFLTLLALSANLQVNMLSSAPAAVGDKVAIMTVRQLPPIESCNSLVSLDSLYGIPCAVK